MLEQTPKDAMTGFFVRDALMPLMQEIIRDLNMYDRKFFIALFDLDHFKKINDSFGHVFGDEVLRDVSSALRSTLENKGYAFRYGGDEFVVIFLDKDFEEVYDLVKKCKKAISDYTFTFKAKTARISISCGISEFPDDGQTVDSLINRADSAAYISKRFGGNLITRAKRVRYIKLRNTFLFLTLPAAILTAVLFLNRYIFEDFIQNTFKQFKAIKIIKDTDTVILKNGSIIRGHIIEEMDKSILIRLGSEGGKAEFSVDKSEIKEIIYALESSQN